VELRPWRRGGARGEVVGYVRSDSDALGRLDADDVRRSALEGRGSQVVLRSAFGTLIQLWQPLEFRT
jgi:hypothetical protein